MKEKRNDAELKNRKTKRNYDYERRVSDIYFDLFFVFVAAGTFLWVIMHSIFDACIDSWKADPALNNFRYMWNILMYVIPYTLWAFAGGFLIVYVRNPLNELINGGIRIFRLKRRMRRENSLGRGITMPRIKPLLVLCAVLLTVTPAASADVNSDMNQFFNKLGFASNTTQPGVWQGQAAGYAYGGSLYARTQVKNIQLISMTLPDI
ncbi:F-type conjugal transfer protein TrbF, partial [Escherichia coli]|nr:F-type conjugal transfer protein TrbF [Escherichia coli]